jgi:hypothetical protein
MDNRVTDVNAHCHLGLDLQNNCKWGDYVSKIYETSLSKTYLQLVYNFAYRLLHTKMYHRQRVQYYNQHHQYQIDRNILINIYLSCIRPMLKYGNVIWDNCTQNEANLLESVQVEAGRIITGLRVNSSRSKLYRRRARN